MALREAGEDESTAGTIAGCSDAVSTPLKHKDFANPLRKYRQSREITEEQAIETGTKLKITSLNLSNPKIY